MRRVMSFLVGAFLAAVAVELVVRQTSFKPWASDPDFGYVFAPGATVRSAVEGAGTSHWTVHGIRRPAPPPSDRPAILTLGDSFTEALMVDDDEVYSQRLETLLAADGSPFVVLNLGRSGTTAADYLALAGRYRALFSPRWTVIQLKDDDVADAAWASGGQARLWRDAQGQLTASFDLKRRGTIGGIAQRLSAWITLPAYGVVRLREFMSAYQKEAPLFRATAATAPPGPADADEYPIEETLERLREAYDGRVTFLYLADYDPKSPSDPATATERRLMNVCHARGWSCVNLRESFLDFSRRHEAPYGFPNTTWNNGHLNAEGHRAAADLLHQEMKRLSARDLL